MGGRKSVVMNPVVCGPLNFAEAGGVPFASNDSIESGKSPARYIYIYICACRILILTTFGLT